MATAGDHVPGGHSAQGGPSASQVVRAAEHLREHPAPPALVEDIVLCAAGLREPGGERARLVQRTLVVKEHDRLKRRSELARPSWGADESGSGPLLSGE